MVFSFQNIIEVEFREITLLGFHKLISTMQHLNDIMWLFIVAICAHFQLCVSELKDVHYLKFSLSLLNLYFILVILLILTISIFILASLMDGWRLQIVLGSPGDSLVQPWSIHCHLTDTNTHVNVTQIQTCKYDTNTNVCMYLIQIQLSVGFSGPSSPKTTLDHGVSNTVFVKI